MRPGTELLGLYSGAFRTKRSHALPRNLRVVGSSGLTLFARSKPMASTQALGQLTVSRPHEIARWAEKYFYLFMSLLIAAVVIYGFSVTVGRKLVYANPRRPILVWVHAVLFSSWLGFYILQSAMVRIRKVKLHRTLGWAGAALGASMVVVGFWVAVVMARFDTRVLHRPNRDAFLIVPLFDMVTFATCFGLAILWRTYPERHRRLMLIATCALTGAAFGRMPLLHGAFSFYAGLDGLILLGVLRDLAVSRRIHAVYMIALPLLVGAQAAVVQVFLHKASFWMRIAHGLIGESMHNLKEMPHSLWRAEVSKRKVKRSAGYAKDTMVSAGTGGRPTRQTKQVALFLIIRVHNE